MERKRLPEYLRRGIVDTEKTKLVRTILKNKCLNTVCEAARCPNKAECYAKNTATFLFWRDLGARRGNAELGIRNADAAWRRQLGIRSA